MSGPVMIFMDVINNFEGFSPLKPSSGTDELLLLFFSSQM